MPMYQNGVKITDQEGNLRAEILSTRKRASRKLVIGMMMSARDLLVVVEAMRMMLLLMMDGLELELGLVGVVVPRLARVRPVRIGTVQAIGTAEVEIGTTVEVEDEVMGMRNLHPLLQRRAPTAILIGNTSSNSALLSRLVTSGWRGFSGSRPWLWRV
jgi:hypothetical protein